MPRWPMGRQAVALLFPVELPKVSLLEEASSVGARITVGGTTRAATLAVEGKPTGHVRIVKGDSVLVDQDLTGAIQPQTGHATEPRPGRLQE